MNVEKVNNVKIYERMLHEVLVADVIVEIEKQIMPKIKANIKQLAVESVNHWALHMKMQKKQNLGYDMTTEISIDFVENVVRTVIQESDIKIKMKG